MANLPYNTDDLLARGNALLAQTKAEGSKSFMGSSYEKNLKKPVSILSTDNALSSVQKGLTTLNQISPTTAPGYVPPAPTQPETTKPAPKAYFTNEAGQEAEFDDKQLKDSATQKFLIENGYVQTRTEGPNFNTGSKIQSDFKKYDSMYEDLVNEFNSYNVDQDPVFQAQASGIAQQYAELRRETEVSNTQRENTFKTLGYRTGASQYAGAIQMGIQGEELRQANVRISEVIRKEAQAISDAREAYRTGRFSQFEKKLAAVEKLRETKGKELTDYNKKLADITKSVREGAIKGTRDSAIASLITQGITDPAQMIELLNFDEQGNRTGDFTAKEVADTMKALSPEGNVEKLTGEVKNYFLLKEEGALPGNISGLPEDQQLGAWLTFMRPPKAAGAAKASNKITLAEAKSNNLPLSTVGLTEEEILGGMYESTPPQWFIDKLSSERNMSVGPEQAKTAWEEYRQAFLTNFESGDEEGGA